MSVVAMMMMMLSGVEAGGARRKTHCFARTHTPPHPPQHRTLITLPTHYTLHTTHLHVGTRVDHVVGHRVEAAEAERVGVLVVELGGVVVHDVEDDLDALGVQAFICFCVCGVFGFGCLLVVGWVRVSAGVECVFVGWARERAYACAERASPRRRPTHTHTHTPSPNTHTRTHARTHTHTPSLNTHTHTHARTHAHTHTLRLTS